jgi:hypothetical protein
MSAVSKEDKAEIDRYNAEIDRPVGELKKQLDTLCRPYQQRIPDEKLKLLPEAIREDVKTALETPKEKRSEVDKYLFNEFGRRNRPFYGLATTRPGGFLPRCRLLTESTVWMSGRQRPATEIVGVVSNGRTDYDPAGGQ